MSEVRSAVLDGVLGAVALFAGTWVVMRSEYSWHVLDWYNYTHTYTLCVAQYLPVPPRDHTMARADQGLVVLLCLHAADLLAELSTKFRESFHIRRILLLTRACLIWNVKALTSRHFQQLDSPNGGNSRNLVDNSTSWPSSSTPPALKPWAWSRGRFRTTR